MSAESVSGARALSRALGDITASAVGIVILHIVLP
jgi:hypothetical protein